jgi:hypothetical protein
MFSASYCQNAKNMYANVNREHATTTITEAMKLMLGTLTFCLSAESVNKEATDATTIAIDGRIKPAQMAEIVPIAKSSLSLTVM